MTAEDRKEYFRLRPVRIAASIVLCIALLLVAIYSLSVNSFEMTMMDAWNAIMDRIRGIPPIDYYHEMIDYVAIDVNAPRTIAGIFIGAILGIAGAVMQTVTRNPLADPYTIGISSAALFGVTISVIFGVCVIPIFSGDASNGINAFVFAMIPAIAIVMVSSFKKLTPTMMILIGIGLMYLFSSITTMLKFNASEEKLQEIYSWSIGTLTGITWDNVLPIIVAFAVVLIVLMSIANKINILTAGDNITHALGENPILIRMICFIISSFGVAICVCYSGTIGFVGLVAPHIARIITGNKVSTLIPASALIGGAFIIIGDVIVRSLPGGLPVGVITALIGSPMFIYFLYKSRKQANF